MLKNELMRAYAEIGARTPMNTDCGQLCGAACCDTDEDGQGGVFLFPGEEALLEDADWGEVLPRREGWIAPLLRCDLPCDREKRPLGCRIFPLTPVRGKDGQWTVRIDARARAMCPLAASGVRGLDVEFVRAVRRALRAIAEAKEGDAFLEKWANLEAEYRRELW